MGVGVVYAGGSKPRPAGWVQGRVRSPAAKRRLRLEARAEPIPRSPDGGAVAANLLPTPSAWEGWRGLRPAEAGRLSHPRPEAARVREEGQGCSLSPAAKSLSLVCVLLALRPQDLSLSKLRKTVKDREVWHSAVHGVAKSRMQLSN